ncbi:MAG: hypothetical protein IJP35_04520 [Clostridia bacterium]|nr:hypothetical protein [Clostridia bacterium]
MKTRTKALLLALCAVLLVVTTVFTTLAFMTATTGKVTNTFTVGKVSITMDEADVNEYGVATGNPRDTENEYKLIPGHTYVKDPTVHVGEGSEESWLFVKITNNIAGALVEDGVNSIAAQLTANGWSAVDGQDGVYAYEDKVNVGDDIKVIGSITVKNEVANLDTYAGKTIELVACAVQADGLATSALAAEHAIFDVQ